MNEMAAAVDTILELVAFRKTRAANDDEQMVMPLKKSLNVLSILDVCSHDLRSVWQLGFPHDLSPNG